jgi:class 3 adenylate cyclase/tetratricopeptide (TPR) repeat protein
MARRLNRQAVWTPYLPRLAIEWAESSPEQLWRELDGSLVFVDISGFTALSERLARRGHMGAEELTDTLGNCFAELLAVAYAAGGSLMKFGGDALLLLFTGPGHPERAVASASHMRSTLVDVGRVATTVGAVRLRMSVGVHSGPLHLFRVGRSHRELILTGAGVTATVEMESTADAGEIVVSPGTAALIPASLVGPPKGAGYLLRKRRMELPLGEVNAVLPPAVDLAEAIPAALREELLAGTVESEHRHATVAFVHFDGTDELLLSQGADAVATALDALVGDVQAAADEQGVTFLGSDVDSDGGKIILVAGAPRAMGDADGRMLRALRCIADGERQLPVRIGVNRGHVFVGEVGPSYRRTFTVMGDAVNLAARLMAKADPGQIVSTAAVLDHANTSFHGETVPPFMVKGKAEPVEAVLVGSQGKRREQDDLAMLPLVGRDRELAIMTDAYDAACAGRGGLLELIGPSGIGKSRLIKELTQGAVDATVIRVFCEPFEARTPYFAFGFLLRGLLGLRARGAEGGSQLRRAVAEAAPALLPWLPLIAGVVDVEVEETAESAALELRFRPERTRQVVVDLIRAIAPGPRIFVIEDGQWLDAPSGELIAHAAVAARDERWLVCVAVTDEDGYRLPDDVVTQRLEVAPLDDVAAAAFVSAAREGAADDDRLLPHERDALVRQAGGNPLFLERLLKARAASDVTAAVHESLEAIVASDIDRLPPADRRLLRYTSVLGATFETALVSELMDEERVPAAAAARRLRAFIEPAGPGLLRFRNQCYREIAYETLPYRRRRELHARAGEIIERRSAEGGVDRTAVLSLHFLHARLYERCWHYAQIAAKQAEAKYANVEAVELFERALAASGHLDDPPRGDIAATWETLGNVALEAGDYAKARAAYIRARRLHSGDPVPCAILCRRQARIALHEGLVDRAARWIRRGLATLDGTESKDGLACRAQLRMQYAQIRQQAGRPRDTVRWCELAIADALASDNKIALADTYALLDWALIDLGHADRATNSRAALTILEEFGELGRLANLTTFMGAFAYWQGSWDEALEHFGRACDALQRAGNLVDAARCTCNAAEILVLQGRYDEALPGLADAIALWRSVTLPDGVTDALLNLGRIAVGQNDIDAAVCHFEEARTLSIGTNEIMGADADAWLAECLLRQGRGQDALVAIDTALQHELAAGGNAHLAMLHRLRGYALVALGKVKEAWPEFDKSLIIGRSRGATYEVALTLEAISVVASRTGMPADPTADDERQALLNQLGVRATPRPPLLDDTDVAAAH